MFNFSKDIKGISGWLTQNEAEFLYREAKKTSNKYSVVEIGSWKGRSTVCLGLGVKDGNNVKVYAIDPHKDTTEHKTWSGKADIYDTYDIFLANIKNAGISEYIMPIRSTSEKAAPDFKKPIAFLFVDGSHHFNHVKLDYELWFPKLITGGTIAFHDAWHSLGVIMITTFMLLTSTQIRNPRLIDTILVVQKVNRNNAFDRIVNFLFIFYRLLFGWIGSVRMHLLGGTNETSTLDKRGILLLKHTYSRIILRK